jgi:ABC-type antimicrobial peptide transport system permease subunit
VFRNWKLFAALLIGVALAATLFSGISVKTDMAAQQSLDNQLKFIRTDLTFSAAFNRTNVPLAVGNVTSIDGVKSVEISYLQHIPVAFLNNTEPDESNDEDEPLFPGFPGSSSPPPEFVADVYVPVTSFPNTSRIYDEWLNKPTGGIPENATYIIAGSQLANKVDIGDTITVELSFYQRKYFNSTTFYVNLTVAGFAELTDDGYAYSTGNYYIYYGDAGYRSDLLIIDWDSTFMKLWRSTLDSSEANIIFSVDVDRQNLIDPYNIDASITNINRVADNIQNRLVGIALYSVYIQNMLLNSLSNYNNDFQNMFINYILISFPIFFAAWYLGYTVSAVSFNIRRREIGLLSTKGLSSGQIQRIFLAESLVIGVIGGLLGLVGGLLLNQYYVGTINLNNLFSSGMLKHTTAITTIIFAIILAVTSVYWSSRKASQIPAVDALRNYMPPNKQTRKRFPLIALIFGSYKIVIFLLGISVEQLLNQWVATHTSMFMSGLVNGIIIFDNVMTYIGPLLFFWGCTTFLIRDSTKFHVVATKFSSAMGELGALAAKNVRRNPGRLAAIAFLIALIIGLSVQTNVQMSSQEDYLVRNLHNVVGADVTVNIVNASRSQEILKNITQNVPGIRNASIERALFAASATDTYSRLPIKIIDPNEWAASAYYEDNWFTGGQSVEQMLKDLKANNNTIILDRGSAKKYDLNLYDEITVNFNSCPRQLKIVGFFGPEPKESPDSVYPRGSFSSYGGGGGGGTVTIYGGGASYIYYSGDNFFSSYVPKDLFNMTVGSDFYSLEYSLTARILISLESGVNGTEVANQIRDLRLEVSGVNSFDEQWQRSVGMENTLTYSDLKILELQNFALIFAVLSASVGTALIAIVSLKERSREATLMSVRGLSFRQLVWIFLMETLTIITFAVILGVIVGAIMAYGNIATINASLSMHNIVTQRLIFPPNALVVVGTYIALIYASTIGAILVMTSQYVTKLEKMVRTR